MTERSASPKAARLAAPGWLDGRLVLGVLLVLVSVVVGARVLSSADRSQTVWGVTHDLAPGARLEASDLAVMRVRLFGNARNYLRADRQPPIGYFLRRGVGARELLPFNALTPPGADVAFRLVTVPISRGHLPPRLVGDQQVDVYVTPTTKAAAASAVALPPRLVLRQVTVIDRQRSGSLAGATGDEPVVLRVRPAEVPVLLAAMAEGRIDLVGVPRLQESEATVEPAVESG